MSAAAKQDERPCDDTAHNGRDVQCINIVRRAPCAGQSATPSTRRHGVATGNQRRRSCRSIGHVIHVIGADL